MESSFQEPAPTAAPKGFIAYDSQWMVRGLELHGSAGDGPKLLSQLPRFADGDVSVEIFLPNRKAGNAGLIVRVARPGVGANHFNGYEVSLDASARMLRLGRHRQNWELIKDAPCDVPVRQWINLAVKLNGRSIEAFVDGKSIIRHEDGQNALLSGRAGLRQWQREAAYSNFQMRMAHCVTRRGDLKSMPANGNAWNSSSRPR